MLIKKPKTTIKNYKKRVSIDEKIEILKEFLQTGEETNTNTIFKGYPIGRWEIQIRSNFKNGKQITKDMFFDLNMYNSFMERASELGLYQKRNVSIFEYIVNKNTDTYIPKEIKADNTQEYWNSIKNYKSPTINREQDVGRNLKV